MEHLKIKRTANSNLQNEINISVIFNYLRKSGPVYRAQVSKALHISAPAVSRAMEHLINKGYLLESGVIKTDKGKKAAKITINSDIGFIVAIDMVKENLRIAVTDFSGKIRELHTSFRLGDTPDLHKRLIEEIKSVAASYKKNIGHPVEMKAISVGIPATTNMETGRLTAVLYENLEKIDLRTILERNFNVPVYLENISKLSAIGEYHYGEGENHRNMIFLEISNGIGAGIIVNNSLVRGNSGYAGEIGYSLTGEEEIDAMKQRKGALERIASIDSMVFEFKKEILLGTESLIKNDKDTIESIDAVILFEAAKKGDTLALRVLDRGAKHLAMCIANLVLTLDPEIVFIGGDIYHLPEADQIFIRPVSAYVAKVLPFKPPVICLSSIGENAGIIGASYMAIETLLTGKYPYRIE